MIRLVAYGLFIGVAFFILNTLLGASGESALFVWCIAMAERTYQEFFANGKREDNDYD